MIEADVLRSFVERNVLVTGGTGLIGRQVVDMLCEAGAKVKVVSLDRIRVDERAEHILGDLRSFEFCKDVIPFSSITGDGRHELMQIIAHHVD